MQIVIQQGIMEFWINQLTKDILVVNYLPGDTIALCAGYKALIGATWTPVGWEEHQPNGILHLPATTCAKLAFT